MKKHTAPLLALFALCLLSFDAHAQKAETPASSTQAAATKPPKAAKLSDADKADVARIEEALNSMKNVSADFLQVNDQGNMRHGSIAIKRPGKMRVTYDAPEKDFIVADGSMVHMWDDEMGQQSSVPVGEGIASFILRDNIKLSGDVVLTRFARFPAKIEVSLSSIKEPEEGELTLIFEDKPLKLRQWRVVDAQGRTTGINLENAREDVNFPDNTFTFVSPKLGKSPNAPKR